MNRADNFRGTKTSHCKHCSQIFDDGRRLGGHVPWCKKNPKYIANLKKSGDARRRHAKEKHPKKLYTLHCLLCSMKFKQQLTEHNFKLGKYKKYCSVNCSNTREHTNESRNQISEALVKHYDKIGRICKIKTYICIYCNGEFDHIRFKKYCSPECRTQSAHHNKSEYEKYKYDCKFTFNVYEYPNKFNISLIEQHGWYSAKNRGDNPNGVTRDHMISIHDGWGCKIPSEIISHPANCKLMLHLDNISKNIKSSITYDELINRITNWNKLTHTSQLPK